MPIYSSNIITSGTTITAAGADRFVILEGVTIGSTSSDAISTTFAGSFQIDGSVFGVSRGLFAVASSALFEINVGLRGHVSGANSGDGIFAIATTVRIVNSGIIDCHGSSGYGVNINNSAASYIVNYGLISANSIGVIHSGNSQLVITNYGDIFGGSAIFGSSGIDLVRNFGTMTGIVKLNDGTDLFDGRGGRVTGFVDGGAGNDTLYGGLGADSLFGEADSDIIYFDAEDLTYGIVDGGAGYDTGYYTDNTTAITINLTTQTLEAYYGSAADELVFSGSLGGFGAFARFGGGNDTYDGSAQADNVDGQAGIDVLYGRGGADVLAGGNGGDWLSGGAGADTFDYNTLTDSTTNASDYIADFSTAQGDKIDLSTITFGAATFNTGYGVGTSVYTFAGGGGTTLVQVYNLASLDMQIVVNQASMAAGDFVL